VQLNNKPVDLI